MGGRAHGGGRRRSSKRADEEADVWPATREIILRGRKYSAVDAFEGQYKLAAFRARAEAEMKDLDFLALPTAGTIYRVADIEREPMRYNINLGHYTNFVNFFGLSALALPAGFRPDGLPFGITLIAPAARRARPAGLRRAAGSALWRCRSARPRAVAADREPIPSSTEDRVSIAVVGAHMSGLPLNGQLIAAGRAARKRRQDGAGLPASTPCPAGRRIGPAWCA